jgi:hypothetical protein
MPLAFSITESMSGSHHFVDTSLGDASDRRLSLRIRCGGAIQSVLNPLSARFLNYDAEGVIRVEGLDETEVPCRGWLRLDYFRDHKIVYKLDFEHGGKPFQFTGEKTHIEFRRPLQLMRAHMTCHGAITDERGRIVSKSVIHSDPGQVANLLRSLRFSSV